MRLEEMVLCSCIAVFVSAARAESPEIELPQKVQEIKQVIDKGLSPWMASSTKEGKDVVHYVVKTTFYYTCIEGDPISGYGSFYEGVKKEGSGVAKRGKKLWHFYYNKRKKRVCKELLFEKNKRGYRASRSPGTLDIGDIAVPEEVYKTYANHIGYMRTLKNDWLRVRVKDVGEDIQERDGYIDVDVYAGTSGIAMTTISEKFFYDKGTVQGYTTELIITDRME